MVKLGSFDSCFIMLDKFLHSLLRRWGLNLSYMSRQQLNIFFLSFTSKEPFDRSINRTVKIMLQNAVEKRSASTAAAAAAAVAHRFGIIPYDTNNTSFSLFFLSAFAANSYKDTKIPLPKFLYICVCVCVWLTCDPSRALSFHQDEPTVLLKNTNNSRKLMPWMETAHILVKTNPEKKILSFHSPEVPSGTNLANAQTFREDWFRVLTKFVCVQS